MSFECDTCHTIIPGSNCAYLLCKIKGWTKKEFPECYAHCKCGYPVRAKEVRNYIFQKKFPSKSTDRSNTTPGYVYCETRNGAGHVYYGTFNKCIEGNGLAASGMSSCDLFEKYS
jgi:hypothetical protein